MHACRCCWIWRSEGMRGGRQMKEGRDGWRDGWMHQGQVFSSVAGLSGWLVVSLLSALEWLGPGLQRMGWPVLHIYIYHSHCHAVCVCVACALCVFEYANKIRQCLWFCACVGVRACAAAIVEHPDVSAASLGVCHWDSGGGVKVTCFKYRQCHDNMPDSTYKSHLHNISPVSLSFSRFFPPLLHPGRQAVHTRRVLPLSRPFKCEKMSCQGFLRRKNVTTVYLRHTMENGTRYKHSAWRRDVKTKQVSGDIMSNDQDPPKKLVSTVCLH